MTDGVEIRTARSDERAALEALQMRASLVWEDYRESLRAHPDAVSIPPEQLDRGYVRVAQRAGRVLGFSVTVPATSEALELDGLFVEPDLQRSGIGRALLEDVKGRMRADQKLEVTAQPRAKEFYEKLGFVEIGAAPTRFGPALRMRLLPKAEDGR
jgi:GNAT superfamily N-acetyltransferase